MKIKETLLISLSLLSLVACSNNAQNNKDRDALQILEEKREYYEELDKKKAKEVEEAKKIEEAKVQQTEVVTEEVKTETEKEKLANMTEDERLMYRVDKAKEKIDNMLDIAKKARQEELDVEETKDKVEKALKNITEEK